jgi:hypothetical protein
VYVSMIEVRISDAHKKLSHGSRFTEKLNRQKNAFSSEHNTISGGSKEGKRREKKEGGRRSWGEHLQREAQ